MKKFLKNNKQFLCENCSQLVLLHPTSSRDHCNHCLWGKHVDINPGDRMNQCRGMLRPIGYENINRKEKIIYECIKCKKRVKCIVAPDDNREVIVILAEKVY